MNKNKFSARCVTPFSSLFGCLLLCLLFAFPADAAESNIIPNPSFETISTTDNTLPQSWIKEKAGTNTTNFKYLETGYAGNRSTEVEIIAYTNGDSHFKFEPQTVSAGTKYDFSFYYKSNVTTEVDAEIHLADGGITYVYIGDMAAAADWTKYAATVTMPANATKATVYATIYSIGYLITDDYSLTQPSAPVPVEGNIVPNSSVETVSNTNTALPQSWIKEKYGKNTTTFSYLKTGHTGTRSLKVNTTSYTNGDAHYKFNAQTVTPGKEYDFSVYYQSNIYTEVDAEIILADGQTTYVYVGNMVPSATWNKFTARIAMPANAATATVYASVAAKGYLITDDYYLAIAPTPEPFNRAIVTLTYDEIASTVHQYGYPLFQKYAIAGDLNIVSEELEMSDMMTKPQLDDFRNLGFEIGAHTVTHPYMTTLTAAQMDNELKNSQTAISNYFGGISVPTFASPYGEYNLTLIEQIKKYYKSHRTTDAGFNAKNTFDPYVIKAVSIESDMSADYVKTLIDQAVQSKAWLVLVYHDIRPDDGSGYLYTTTPENMESVLSYLKANNIATLTTSQALSEIQSQP